MENQQQGLSSDTVLTLDGEVANAAPQHGGFDEVDVDMNATAPAVVAQAEPAQAETEERQERGIGYLPPSTTTKQEHEVFFDLSDTDWNDGALTISGPADTRERTQQAIDAMPNIDPTTTEEGREWAARMQDAISSAPGRDQWRASMDRAGSDWRQGVDSQAGPLRMSALSFKNLDGGTVSGEKAVLQVRALIGLGTVIQVPLWHSGFWLSIKAPGESQMIELNRRLTDEKIVVGRTTNGLAFANTSSYIHQTLLDFLMDYIYDTSLQDKSKDTIRSLIQSPDLPLLYWGLASAIWPRGFQYARPYIDPVTKAEKILKQKLGMSKLLWVDTKSFTPWQVTHMSNKLSGSMSTAMVKRYRDEFTIGAPKRVQLSDSIAVTLRVPSAVEYVVAGQKWIGQTTKTVDDAFSETPDDARRANFIVRHSQATAMRQYTHWVGKIEAAKSTIEDVDTIEKILNDLSGDDGIRDKFFDEVKKFIDDSTLALIGTPAALHEKEDTLPRFPHVLPMNVEHTFFTLLEQKVMQIIQRI
jgi:hypothetical protein